MATAHKRFNSIEQLDVEENTIKNLDSIKEMVQNFYKDLYKEMEHWRPDLKIHEGARITEEERLWQQRAFRKKK